MNEYNWYTNLIKPEWAPPAWLFWPVWSFLYLLIIISFGYVFYMKIKKQIPAKVIIPFIINIISNIAFTPIQFGLKNNLLAAIDIIIVLVSLLFCIKQIYPYKKWISYTQIPYLLWVSFATILQFTITYLNL